MWFQNNKVVLLSILMAVLLSVQQFAGSTPVNVLVVVFAALIAGLGVLANNLRGQWATIVTSVIGTITVVQQNIQTGNKISWYALLIALGIAIIGVFLPPTKPASYELNPTIVAAKQTPPTP